MFFEDGDVYDLVKRTRLGFPVEITRFNMVLVLTPEMTILIIKRVVVLVEDGPRITVTVFELN